MYLVIMFRARIFANRVKKWGRGKFPRPLSFLILPSRALVLGIPLVIVSFVAESRALWERRPANLAIRLAKSDSRESDSALFSLVRIVHGREFTLKRATCKNYFAARRIFSR